MKATRAMFRASRIGRVMLRYRLDDLFDGTPAERWLRIARPFVPRARDVAAARALLCQAAARRWGADWRSCDTAGGFVIHGNQKFGFGALAA